MRARSIHKPPAGSGNGNDLRRILRRFAGVPDGQAGPGLLPRLLQEIDETMLPRELTVTCGGKDIAVLMAAQRRLAGLRLAGQAETANPPETPAEAARFFAARLQRLGASCGASAFGLRRSPCTPPPGAASCSAAALAALLDAPETPGGGLRSLQAAAAAHALAWLYAAEGTAVPETAGPEDLVSRLAAARQAARPRMPAAAAALPAQHPSCAILPLTGEARVIAAFEAGSLLLMAADGAGAEAILAAWETLYGAV